MSTEYLVYVLIAIVIVLAVLVVHLEIKMKRFLRGKNALSLEDTLLNLARELGSLKEADNARAQHLANVETRVKRSIQGTSVHRFNPFKDVGSNQSFATALLNEHGHGVVFSSLYSRDRTSVFSKPVRNFASEYDLTPEEQSAIDQARTQ